MFQLFLALVVLVGMTATFVQVVRLTVTEHRIRRVGQPVIGEVVDLDTRRRAYYGGYSVKPVVSYRIDGHDYRAPVGNRTDAAGIGAGLDLIVDPARPYDPLAATGGRTPTALAVSLVGVLLGAGLTVVAVVQL